MLFGMTEAQFSEFAVRWGTLGLMLLMLFIIGDLARKSKAGRTGTKALFFVLAFGMVSFVAKTVLEWVMAR